MSNQNNLQIKSLDQTNLSSGGGQLSIFGNNRGKNMVKLPSKNDNEEEQMVFENEYID